jgi:hypothetical protein
MSSREREATYLLMEPSSIGGDEEVVVATAYVIEEELLEAAQANDPRSS